MGKEIKLNRRRRIWVKPHKRNGKQIKGHKRMIKIAKKRKTKKRRKKR